MKSKIIIAQISVLMLFYTSALHASSLICAGRAIHYSSTRVDTGMPPKPGFKVGSQFLAIEGKLISRQNFYAGVSPENWPLNLEFGSQTILYASKGQANEMKIYGTTLKVVEKRETGKITLVEEPVVCTKAWNSVP